MPADSTPPSVPSARSGGLDWSDLCAQLSEEFPDLSRREIIEMVARARSATDLFGLDSAEQLRLTETIARNNMAIATGSADLARLDPEHHVRRTSMAD